jgi:hypothetical protein
VVEGDGAGRTGGQGDQLVADRHLHGGVVAWACAERHLVVGDLDVDALTAVADLEPQAAQVVGEPGVEVEGVVAGFEPGVGALEEVDGAGRGAEVDALGGGAALGVVE